MEMAERFRGFLPVVVDIETGGFDAQRNPILEIAAVTLRFDADVLIVNDTTAFAVQPFAGSSVDSASLAFTGIDPNDPTRNALPEAQALQDLFRVVRRAVREAGCHRAVLVAHNASFDHGFLHAAAARVDAKRNPFHPFTTIDTAALAAVACGHTVLSEACQRAGIPFAQEQAHRAAYDAERAAHLFCYVVNLWPWPADDASDPSGASNPSGASEA